ncbi:hypothetical protein PUNSTDRAFT_50771 [Punctularia strigosozonata HHB-11173 SS5]|uniref:uncharacterized protein n=1 Tax=Punctularia strigosozonata (strain HHB-11173) TaxID=741275 RepID=UPI00044184D8|nr:uncharacterized protein PUNSTDRAFT_50771 [Punctularia strigosozonata HHB-11173 SS5]EIN12106.1 hypothetical protein PUNSTDRAFT_50771 [Punctularia strigosozonata HHB-11173 SS5]
MAAITLVALTTILITGVSLVNAETHTIRFDNQCGHGTPILLQNGNILSKGEDYTHTGSFSSAIAYLQTGDCEYNGENCTLMELTLGNPTCAGCGSSADLSLIPPHAFSVTTSFSYFNGCDGTGATCSSSTCDTAFFVPDDNQVQVACQADNVDILISFCGDATETVKSGFKSASSSVKASATSTHSTAASSKHSSSAIKTAAAATSSLAAVVGVESAPASSSATSSASAASASSSATRKTCKRSSPSLERKAKRAAKRAPSPAPEALKAHRRHSRQLNVESEMH